MNEDQEQLSLWFRANRLAFNVSKTQCCYFRNRTAKNCDGVTVNGERIELSNHVKYLGIHVDKDLSWKEHISYVTRKLLAVNGVLCKSQHLLPVSARRSVYFSLVHSRLQYCMEIWGLGFKHKNPLIIAQKKILRNIAGVPRNSHTSQLFKNLSIMPLKTELEYRLSLFSFQVIKKSHEFSIDIPTTHPHTHDTRFSRNNIPAPRFSTVRHGKLGLKAIITNAYNKLPGEIKRLTIHHLNAARRLLKKHFWNTLN